MTDPEIAPRRPARLTVRIDEEVDRAIRVVEASLPPLARSAARSRSRRRSEAVREAVLQWAAAVAGRK